MFGIVKDDINKNNSLDHKHKNYLLKIKNINYV